jgi:tellurite resistance protein
MNKQEAIKAFVQSMQECRNLYVQCGMMIADQYPHLIPEHETDFVAMMDDLHKGLIIKLFVSISDSDLKLAREEQYLANLVVHHVWRQQLKNETMSSVISTVRQEATSLRWYSLVRPFDEIAPLREHIGELETLIFRMANLIAKADGEASQSELELIEKIQRRLSGLLHGVGVSSSSPARPATSSMGTIATIATEHQQVRATCNLADETPLDIPDDTPKGAATQGSALEELEKLIGLEAVKTEVRTLINFLDLQNKRQQLGLPLTPLSLHLVFQGNPGTGKTTIARILGQVYKSMNILKKGHLVETDRGGLVAQYSGQTAPKANEKIDEALDGILFIDEAYSLVAEQGDDPFGLEALQTLLKRMEDDRERLVVILAGYPADMQRLLKSNPGLSSRFNLILDFEDYKPGDLGRIFGSLCAHNRYEFNDEFQARLLTGLNWMYQHRDSHFGNGRTVRNLFENSIRHLANRIARQPEITPESLVTFLPEDVNFPKVPSELLRPECVAAQKFMAECPKCQHHLAVDANELGYVTICPGCKEEMPTDWAEPISSENESEHH